MELTSKGRYAVRVMVDIARNGDHFVSLAEISERQEISIKYLEKVIGLLNKAKLLESMRGANGGYKLVKSPNQYTLKEILDATGDSPKMAACVNNHSCPKSASCDTQGVWNSLNDLINDFLSKTSLQDLIDKTFNK